MYLYTHFTIHKGAELKIKLQKHFFQNFFKNKFKWQSAYVGYRTKVTN